MDKDASIPAVAGLAAGMAFVIAFSLLAGSSSSALETRRISMTIDGLQDNYEVGEPIVFSVAARGIMDNACNYGKPSVTMRDEGTGRTIYWPNPFEVITAMQCATGGVDGEWTFGDAAGNEIVLENPGRYSVVASFAGASVERQFSVTSP